MAKSKSAFNYKSQWRVVVCFEHGESSDDHEFLTVAADDAEEAIAVVRSFLTSPGSPYSKVRNISFGDVVEAKELSSLLVPCLP